MLQNSKIRQLHAVICKPLRYYISKKNYVIELTDLVRPQKELLFSQINISEIFPELNNAKLIDLVWKDFYSIYITCLNLTRIVKKLKLKL